MADLLVSMTKAPVAHVATHPVVHQVIHQAGVSMSYFLIGSIMAGCAICGGLGYYVAHRGIAGVANDLTNIKNDIAMLKAKLNVTA